MVNINSRFVPLCGVGSHFVKTNLTTLPIMLHHNISLVFLLWLIPRQQLFVSCATSNPCTSVSSITSILKSHSNSAFCSSILPITTKTVTYTKTSTVKSTVATATKTTTATYTASPITVVETISTTVTRTTKTATAPAKTKTVTVTITANVQARQLDPSISHEPVNARAAVSTPTYLTKYASKSLSLACSCWHLSTPTVTTTKTIKTTSKATKTAKVTETLTVESTTTVTSQVTVSRTATTTITPVTTKTVTSTVIPTQTLPCPPGQIQVESYSPWEAVYDGHLFPADGSIACDDRTVGNFNLGVQTPYDYMLDYCKDQVEKSGGRWNSYYVSTSKEYEATYDTWLIEDVYCLAYVCQLDGTEFTWDIDKSNSCNSTCDGWFQVSQNKAFS